MKKPEAQIEADAAVKYFSALLKSKWSYSVAVVSSIKDSSQFVFSDIDFNEVDDGGPTAKIRISMVGLQTKNAAEKIWGRVAHEIVHGYWFDEVNAITDLDEAENGAVQGSLINITLDRFEERACEAIEALAHELRRKQSLCES